MRLTTSGKEETLTTQISEIQQNLRNLARKKQNELSTSKHIRESYKHKIDDLKNSLQKYNDELQIASTSIIEKKRIRENSTVAKARVYDESLVPLEIDERDLSIIKENLTKKIALLQEESKMLNNAIEMNQEDLENRYNSRSENIVYREAIEANLDFFIKEYSDEINFFKEESDYLKNLSNCVNLQHKYKEEVYRLEYGLDIHNFNIEKLENKLNIIQKEIEAIINNNNDIKTNSEINKLEFMISQICQENGIEKFENVVLELNALEKFDIDEEILKLQLAKIRLAESQIRQEYELEERQFSEMIIIKNYENCSTDEIEENFRIKKSQYRNRLAAISQ